MAHTTFSLLVFGILIFCLATFTTSEPIPQNTALNICVYTDLAPFLSLTIQTNRPSAGERDYTKALADFCRVHARPPIRLSPLSPTEVSPDFHVLYLRSFGSNDADNLAQHMVDCINEGLKCAKMEGEAEIAPCVSLAIHAPYNESFSDRQKLRAEYDWELGTTVTGTMIRNWKTQLWEYKAVEYSAPPDQTDTVSHNTSKTCPPRPLEDWRDGGKGW